MKHLSILLLTVAFTSLPVLAQSAADTAKPGAGSGAHGGSGTDAAHSEPSTPPSNGSAPTKKSPPTVEGEKPEGHGATASGPDVSTGQGGKTGPASAPGGGK